MINATLSLHENGTISLYNKGVLVFKGRPESLQTTELKELNNTLLKVSRIVHTIIISRTYGLNGKKK